MTDIIDTGENLNAVRPDNRSNAIKHPKEILTPKRIKQLLKIKSAPGERLQFWDAELPGFGVRITDRHHSYIFAGRFPGSKSWARREIAACDEIDLGPARDIARDWIKLIAKGIDPAVETARLEREEARKRADTFA